MIEWDMDRPPPAERDDLKAFLLVLRQAFRLVNAWIERRYGLRATE